jgi:hypothetical protein
VAERIRERDLIVPALYCISKADKKTLSTSALIQQMRDLLKPTGEELERLVNRNDDRFSQKVRNLRSHRTLEKPGYCTYQKRKDDGYWTITNTGEAYLEKQQNLVNRIVRFGFQAIEEAFTHQDLEEALAERTGVEFEEEGTIETTITKPFDPTKIRIISRTLTVDLVIKRIIENEIILDPDFQRAAGIWADADQSRLIESILLRIPLPAFYMDASDDDKWIVIDGLQRLTTLRRFLLEKELRLKNLEFLSDYNNLNYDELPRNLQRRIEETQLTLYLVERGTPPQAKLNIFKRINTTGTPLSSQEIRHALNLGPATKLLKELAESEAFRRATDYGISPLRMADRECVLRFLAFKLREYHTYKDDLDTFLLESMQKLNVIGSSEVSKLDYLKHQFEQAMNAAYEIFGKWAFRKVDDNSSKRPPVSKALFEAWSVNLSELDQQQLLKLISNKETLIQKFRDLMDDTEFVIAISYSTGDARRVRTRFSKINQIIKEIVD